MKGVVFSEFMDMVEDTFGEEILETIIEKAMPSLSSQGAYTAIGTYPHQEMVALVVALSDATNIKIEDLLHAFGKHLLGRFATLYNTFFQTCASSFDFIQSIDNHIHVEVRKLYPDAELPRFETVKVTDDEMVMIYRSDRAMGSLAAGLLEGCFEYYKENITYEMTNLEAGDGKKVEFRLTKHSNL